MMKILFVVLISLTPFICNAQIVSVSGKVNQIRVHEPGHGQGSWEPPLFWFSLDSVTQAGSCKRYSGKVLFIAEHEYYMSILLSSRAQGEEVIVHYDETKTRNEFCRAVYLTTSEKN